MNCPYSNLYHLHMLSHSLQQLSLIIVMCNVYSKVYRSTLHVISYWPASRRARAQQTTMWTCAGCSFGFRCGLLALRIMQAVTSYSLHYVKHWVHHLHQKSIGWAVSNTVYEVTYVYFMPGTFIQIVLSTALIVSCRCSGSTLPLRLGVCRNLCIFVERIIWLRK